MKRILIIDDNEDIRKIIGYDLIKAGFDVDDAQDGESGYQMIQKEKNRSQWVKTILLIKFILNKTLLKGLIFLNLIKYFIL